MGAPREREGEARVRNCIIEWDKPRKIKLNATERRIVRWLREQKDWLINTTHVDGPGMGWRAGEEYSLYLAGCIERGDHRQPKWRKR